ncbi:PAS domain S-box [Desulfocapsa sulfexigens DSM 10523]|uniref:histidine kinase n=1 Tax=Desulfocapsa sulfexigens (strain DSM 10523 / SB164P1) TaxID=1167006 RepID=M1P4T7_DESSD|nr:PAS domain S-box protein [Desulfocapsa sulfexigens]AGF76722.1 PAS domain S-box [Desulfocapsa sulfexigens DSM 10523]
MGVFKFGSINKSLAILLLVTILPTLTILLYSGLEQRSRSIEDAKEAVFLLTHSMAGVQKDITHNVRQTLFTLSLLPEVQRLNGQASNEIFQTILKKNPLFINIVLTDLKGKVITSGKALKKPGSIADCKHFKETLASKAFATGEFVYTRTGEPRPAFTYAYPVLAEDNSLIAVLATAIQLDHLDVFYKDLNLDKKSFISVTDHRGIRLFYYPAAEETNPVGSQIKPFSLEQSRKTPSFGRFTGTGSDGARRVFAFENIRLATDLPSYMTVWAGIPEASVLAKTNAALSRNLIFFFLSAFCSILLFWLVGKKVLLAPIAGLMALTREYSAGNLEARSKQDTGPREFIDLTEAFYTMAAALSSNQQSLQEKEDRFRGVFNSMSSGVAIYEVVGNGEGFIFKDINPAGARSSQLSHDNIIGKRVREVFPAVRDIGLFSVFQRVWQAGRAEHHPATLYSDDRITLWVENHVFKLPSGEIVSVYDDITERKQFEEGLRESEEKFRALINQATDSIYVLDMEANIILANRQACKSTGYSETELLQLTIADIDPYFITRKDKDILWKELVPGEKQVIESHLRAKDGTMIPVEVHLGLIEVNNKKSILGIVRDITARLEFERSLRRSKEEWESTFDAMGDIITIQDKEMRILKGNKTFYDTFEGNPDTLNGRYCYEVFRGRSQPCPNCPELSTPAGKHIHSGEIFHKTLDKIFHVSSYPIQNGTGELDRLVHIARDITEQKRIQEDLFQSHKMEAVGTLAGGIAHDFNNILSAIMGAAQLVKRELPEKSPALQDIDTVLQSGRRAADLIRQILTFSRKKEHKLQSLAPHPIIKEALQMLRSSLPSTIEIEEEIDRECGAITADPTSIHQIIVNLCTNALHAIDQQKGKITVRLYREDLNLQDTEAHPDVSAGPFVVLSVSDTGHGMDETTMQKVFEPYFTTKEIGKGSGIGLSVLHGIVQDYKGFINVESTLGKGSTFRVYLPLTDKTAISTSDEQQPVQLTETGSGRILVVDDEEFLVRINKRRLESVGYTVTTATDSTEALKMFRAHPETFDLLITDQTMPKLSGAELASEILKIRPDLPVIMSTGHSDVVSEEKALEMGITKYVQKPIQGNELLEAAQELLGR